MAFGVRHTRGQVHTWQLNILRAQFDPGLLNDTPKLFWRIEFDGTNADGGREMVGSDSFTREFTPPMKKGKPVWNYWTQIRESSPKSQRLTFTLLSKGSGKAPLGIVMVDLSTKRRVVDEAVDEWLNIEDPRSGKVIGKLRTILTYKSVEVDIKDEQESCFAAYCDRGGHDGTSCIVM